MIKMFKLPPKWGQKYFDQKLFRRNQEHFVFNDKVEERQ